MGQNIYDDQAFLDEYAKMPRSVNGLEAAPEWPALRSPRGMLGSVKSKRVLDLGCGYGWFCRWAVQAGAEHVHGIDVSQKMLERANTPTRDAKISLQKADLDQLRLEPGSYGVIYSSLAFHYLSDLDRLFGGVHRALSSQGPFAFSVEHPISTAPNHRTW